MVFGFERKRDSFQRMQLLDLARGLTKNPSLQIEYDFYSHIDCDTDMLFVSSFWDDYGANEQLVGMKSDVVLRCVGSARHTSQTVIQNFLQQIKEWKIPRFSRQLFALLEDVRLESICLNNRPGTKHLFEFRSKMYLEYFQKRYQLHSMRKENADACLSAFYIWLKQDLSSFHDTSLEVWRTRFAALHVVENQIIQASSTEEIVKICTNIIRVLLEWLEKDMISSYFLTDEHNGLPFINVKLDNPLDGQPIETSVDLKRNNPLNNEDAQELSQDKVETSQEKLPTWHRETKEQNQSFLQFELEQGVKTNLTTDTARESDTSDQAFGQVQGSASTTKRNDFSEADEHIKRVGNGSVQKESEPSSINHIARAVYTYPKGNTVEQIDKYQELVAQILPFKKRLQRSIQKTMEQRKTAARTDLLNGRIGKKLVRVVIDDDPRLFYKKQNPDRKLDAVFVLLVDCSASMADKMQQTQLGVTLFHETLYTLQVPHAIIGFWEDNGRMTADKYPNYFQVIMDFSASLRLKSGPNVMQLSPKQDNRDGFAIREMTKYLRDRMEKQRILLVISDGEPAAMDYNNEQGIVDTYQAVHEARRQGIDVISLYLKNGEIEEREVKAIQSIYGRYSVFVPAIDQLPQQLTPLLRKLLLKSI